MSDAGAAAPLERDITGLDAAYSPFPGFEAFQACRVSDEVWQEYVSALEARRATADPTTRDRAVRLALRAAAFDTGALEGLYDTTRGVTLTIASMSAAWTIELERRGPEAAKHFEAQLDAYELVLDAATGRLPISQAWLRRLHEVTTGGQETYDVSTAIGWQKQSLPKGEYKTRPNHVRQPDGTLHAYAPVDRTNGEMQRLVDVIGGEAFESAHPVLQAAYAHYALVAVHPFADGNGRVARALASVFLYRAVGTPLIVFAEDRSSYLSVLSRADEGDYQPFVDFVFDSALDSIGLVTATLREAGGPSLEQRAERITAALRTPSGLLRQELHAVGLRLLGRVEDLLHELADGLRLPEGCRAQIGRAATTAASRTVPDGYEPVRDERDATQWVDLTFSAAPPVSSSVFRRFYVGVSAAGGADLPLVVHSEQTRHSVKFRLTDVQPYVRDGADRRLHGWLEDELGEALDEFAEALRMREQ